MLENFELVDAVLASEDSAAQVLAGMQQQLEDTVQREVLAVRRAPRAPTWFGRLESWRHDSRNCRREETPKRFERSN